MGPEIDQTSELPARHWNSLWLLIGIPLYLYANLFALPLVPFLLAGDQTYFWVYALRMLHGEHVYKDFFQFTPPGIDLFFVALFRLFGARIWVTNFAVLFMGVILCWMCFYLAKRLMERNLAILAALLFSVAVYGARLDVTHHWFSLLAAMGATYVVMPERTTLRITAAGALLGIGSFFTQTAGVAGVLAVLFSLLWEQVYGQTTWRKTIKCQGVLLLAFVLAWLALSAHYIADVGWKQIWYFQITYPRRYVVLKNQFLFPGLPLHISLRELPDLVQRLSIYVLLLVIYPAVLWNSWRKQRGNMRPVLLAMMGLFLLLEIITRANWNRIYIAAMPGLILFVWVLGSNDRLRRYAIAATSLLILCVAAMQIRYRHHFAHRILELPAGKAVLPEDNYEEFTWLMQHTRPGDYFFQGTWLNFYPPLNLRSPVFVDGLWGSDTTRPEDVSLTVRQLEQKRVKYVLWTPQWVAPTEDSTRPWTNHLGPILSYLSAHYTRIHVFSNQDEIWKRR